MNAQLVFIALSPAVALVWFFYVRNTYRPESKLLITVLFVLGFVAGLVALVLNHMVEKYTMLWPGAQESIYRQMYWVFGIGLNEEFAKMLMLLLVLYPRRDFITPYQGLLGATTVALGFAAIENIFYLERYGTMTLLIRSGLTVPAHAFFTAPLGVGMGLAKGAATLRAKYLWMVGGLAFSISAHGLYDILLSVDLVWMNRLGYLHVVVLGLFTLWLMRLKPLRREAPPGEGPDQDAPPPSATIQPGTV